MKSGLKQLLSLALRTFRRGDTAVAHKILDTVLSTPEATAMLDNNADKTARKNKLIADITEKMAQQDYDGAEECIDEMTAIDDEAPLEDDMGEMLENGDTSETDGGTQHTGQGYKPQASVASVLSLAKILEMNGYKDLSLKLKNSVKAAPNKDQRRTAWNQQYVAELERLGVSTVNLDWDTASHFYFEKLSPKDAAKRTATKASVTVKASASVTIKVKPRMGKFVSGSCEAVCDRDGGSQHYYMTLTQTDILGRRGMDNNSKYATGAARVTDEVAAAFGADLEEGHYWPHAPSDPVEVKIVVRASSHPDPAVQEIVVKRKS